MTDERQNHCCTNHWRNIRCGIKGLPLDPGGDAELILLGV